MESLKNWGNWHRSIVLEQLGYPRRQPMFREYFKAHRNQGEVTSIYDEDQAVELDRVIAERLSYKQIQVLLCEFCFDMTSRQAADYLTHKGFQCNKDTYLRWLDLTITCITDGK